MITRSHQLPLIVTTLVVVMLLIVPLQTPPAGAIVGGGPSQDGAWPSTVALLLAADSDDMTAQVCGGTAIAPDLVLTAAHCLEAEEGGPMREASEFRVVAGRTDLSADGGVEAFGFQTFIHPSYDPASRRFDAAILRVNRELDVPTQRLATADAPRLEAGSVVVILGWGRTGAGPEAASSLNALLNEAHVPVATERRCRAAFDGGVDPISHLCAGGGGRADDPKPDSCNGDSGGPLLLPVADDQPIQMGITAFGPDDCGVGQPGVYSRVAAVRPFIDDVIAGVVAPADPDEPATPDGEPSAPAVQPVRVAGPTTPTTAISQAVAASRAVFTDSLAEIAVIARDDAFPDGLAGSSLVFGRGPLLFTPPVGPLAEETRAEVWRVLRPGSTVYLLGGQAAVPAEVEDAIRAGGFTPVRLAGPGREATAAAVAREAVAQHGSGQRPPFGTVVLATSAVWPDAVLAGQMTAYWGYPVVLTPPDRLHEVTADVLAGWDVDRLLVVGGHSAITEEVAQLAGQAAGAAEVLRIAGTNRVETGLRIAAFHRAELQRRGQKAPGTAVVVNVRRDDGYAHILSATPILGASAGILVPVERVDGDLVLPEVTAAICGLATLPVGIGGADILADAAFDTVARALASTEC